MGVEMSLIPCYLRSSQSVCYSLQTGFGLLEISYGGSPDFISMGPTHGSGGAPDVWPVISTVILGVYKTCCYGASLNSRWLVYVDDTDLLHCPHHSTFPQD